MNARQLRQHRQAQNEIFTNIIMFVVGFGLILVLALVMGNMLLGDNGRVCQTASPQMAAQLHCK